jgi:hypothetical protein
MNEYPNPYPSTAPKTEGMATASLVLGILSFVACSIFSGIPAIITGHIARSRIQGSNGTLGGGGLATAGLVLGYLSVALVAVVIIAFVLFGAAFTSAIPGFQQTLAEPAVKAMGPRIVAACNQYRADNGKFPAATATAGEQVNADELFAVLAAKDATGNPYYSADGNGIHINGKPMDPWGEILQVAVDLNGDGKVDLNGTLIDGSVLVWSKGANKQNEFGTGDDVKSW